MALTMPGCCGCPGDGEEEPPVVEEPKECCETGATFGPGTYNMDSLVALSPGINAPSGFVNWVVIQNDDDNETLTLTRLGNLEKLCPKEVKSWGKEDRSGPASPFALVVPAGAEIDIDWSYVKG